MQPARRGWNVAGLLLSLVALASCTLGSVDPERPYASGETTRVLEAGLGIVDRYHLAPRPLSEMVLRGLNGLASLDRNLRFDLPEDRDQLEVRRGSWTQQYPVRNAVTAEEWSRLAVTAIDAARGVSPTIRAARAEQLYELLFDAAFSGLDRYTLYLSAREARSNRARRRGYSGIGLSIDGRPGFIRVKEVFANGPARQAGIRKDDIIVQIDGVPITEWSLARIGETLRGPRGTPVTLVLSRAGRTFEITVTRQNVVVQTVFVEIRDGYALIRISGFNDKTARSFADAMEAIEDAAVSGLVIDLRGNPGGVLDETITIADRLLADGTILSTRGRHPGAHQLFEAHDAESGVAVPLVVLIDRGSASATEVLAAALGDHRRAVLIGGTTRGKGTVQRLHELPNTGQVNVTWARMHSPSGRSIDGHGVRPAICTGDLDSSLDLALEQIRHLHRVNGSPDCNSASGTDFNIELAARLLADNALYQRLRTGGTAGATLHHRLQDTVSRAFGVHQLHEPEAPTGSRCETMRSRARSSMRAANTLRDSCRRERG